MNTLFRNFFRSLPLGPRLLVLVFLLGFPLAQLGSYTHAFQLYDWLCLSPALVWKGQAWRMVTYGFLSGSVMEWILGAFWLATLISILGRNWTSAGFWGYCVLGVVAGALPFVLFRPALDCPFGGCAAMIFALVVAWDWFCRNERLVLLGIGGISSRQAAVLVALVNSLVLYFCSGWFVMLAMWCGGVAGWLWLTLRSRLFLGKTPEQIRSERIARLEL